MSLTFVSLHVLFVGVPHSQLCHVGYQILIPSSSATNHPSINIKTSTTPMATRIPLTLPTLPAKIRNQIWDYCLVSPTCRAVPVHYGTKDSLDYTLPSPIIWTATRRVFHPPRALLCRTPPQRLL